MSAEHPLDALLRALVAVGDLRQSGGDLRENLLELLERLVPVVLNLVPGLHRVTFPALDERGELALQLLEQVLQLAAGGLAVLGSGVDRCVINLDTGHVYPPESLRMK